MASRRRPRRVIHMKVLPGEPLDGSGRVCIHLFLQDPAGAFVEPNVIHPVYKDGVQVKQQVECKAARGRLACDPRRNPASVTQRGVTTVTPRTDDPRATTCPKCLASVECQEMMLRLNAS